MQLPLPTSPSLSPRRPVTSLPPSAGRWGSKKNGANHVVLEMIGLLGSQRRLKESIGCHRHVNLVAHNVATLADEVIAHFIRRKGNPVIMVKTGYRRLFAGNP